MSKIITICVCAGAIIGYLWVPASFFHISEYFITIGLSALLFFVGIDLGMQGGIWENIKKAGIKILLVPSAAIVGSLIAIWLVALVLPIRGLDAVTVGSGLGWYSFAPLLIDPYSTELSAMSFLSNIFRELFGILFIPIVAKKVGYLESTVIPGGAAMDVCLPIIEKSTSAEVTVYGFLVGVIMSVAVPVILPVLLALR